MSYCVNYACTSHIGNVRNVNQDNFICVGQYMNPMDEKDVSLPLTGTFSQKNPLLFGIFDGMGGEEKGEVASYIASKMASSISFGKDLSKDLLDFCHAANAEICKYAKENGIFSMGTTAAMLAFSKKKIILCNIGDSKIFRFSDGELNQISIDHVVTSVFGMKPPLSQNLGIPVEELIIDPYLARGGYKDGDIYLICSDGLTDMVSVEDIRSVLMTDAIDEAIVKLLDMALENGGKDNITVILCRIERNRIFSKKHKKESVRGEKNKC